MTTIGGSLPGSSWPAPVREEFPVVSGISATDISNLRRRQQVPSLENEIERFPFAALELAVEAVSRLAVRVVDDQTSAVADVLVEVRDGGGAFFDEKERRRGVDDVELPARLESGKRIDGERQVVEASLGDPLAVVRDDRLRDVVADELAVGNPLGEFEEDDRGPAADARERVERSVPIEKRLEVVDHRLPLEVDTAVVVDGAVELLPVDAHARACLSEIRLLRCGSVSRPRKAFESAGEVSGMAPESHRRASVASQPQRPSSGFGFVFPR